MGNKQAAIRRARFEEIRGSFSEDDFVNVVHAFQSATPSVEQPKDSVRKGTKPFDESIVDEVLDVQELAKALFVLKASDGESHLGSSANNGVAEAVAIALADMANSWNRPGDADSGPKLKSGSISFHGFAMSIQRLLQGSDALVLRFFDKIASQCGVSRQCDRMALCFGMMRPLGDHTHTFDKSHFDERCRRSGVFPVPLGAKALRQFIRARCGLLSAPWVPFRLPILDGGKSQILVREHIFALACSSSRLQESSWTRLFSLAEQGTNFSGFCDQLLGYDGPTIICVLDDAGRKFGVVMIEPWKLCDKFYGSGAGCFLFTLGSGPDGADAYSVLRPRARGAVPHYQYMNTKDHRSDLLAGLGSGGETDFFRFLIKPDFSGEWRDTGLTFEMPLDTGVTDASSARSSGASFKAVNVEVWGAGGKAALDARMARKEEERQFIAERRKVDKAQLMDGFTQQFLLGNTFKHKEETQSRDGGRD